MTLEDQSLDKLLKQLHLANTRRIWRDLTVRAEKESWSYRGFLETVVQEEIAQRKGTRLRRVSRQAHFPFLKTIDDFDFTLQSTLRLQMLGSFLSPDFVTEGRSLILSGKTGRGKTHLAIAIAYRAIQNGFTARFTTAAELIDDLSGRSGSGGLREAIAGYVRPDVLVCDEVGYLTYGDDAANVLFHVVNERNLKRRAMIFTTNKKLSSWGNVLHDDDLAAAIIDRILERGRLIKLDGPSGRTKGLELDAELEAVSDDQPARISGTGGADFPEPTQRSSVHPREAAIADAVARFPSRVIVHDEVLQFAQAMCLMYSGEQGREPADAFLSYLLLAANDHTRAAAIDASGMTEKDELLAGFLLTTLFNRTEDPIRAFARMSWIMSAPPVNGPLSGMREWRALQEQAFGASFVDYFDFVLGPLAFAARRWGTNLLPLINPERLVETDKTLPSQHRAWLNDLTTDLDAAITMIAATADADGVPRVPLAISRTPIVRLDRTTGVVVNPAILADQLHLGVWGRCNTAAKQLHGERGSQIWTTAFGDRFEAYCRRIAKLAESGGSFLGRVLVAQAAGTGEIEDVTLDYGTDVVLFSVKASTVPAAALRRASALRDSVGFLRRFLFEPPAVARSKKHRGGAAYLLDAAIRRLRTGELVPTGIASTARIFPIVVTFDEMADGPALYLWVDEVCRELGLLQQPDVFPLSIIRVDDYEALLAAAAARLSVADFLRDKLTSSARFARMDYALAKTNRPFRLPALEREFEAIADRIQERLFGKTS